MVPMASTLVLIVSTTASACYVDSQRLPDAIGGAVGRAKMLAYLGYVDAQREEEGLAAPLLMVRMGYAHLAPLMKPCRRY